MPEKDVLNLIELLMTQLVKLDGVVADGDLKLQKRMQVNFDHISIESWRILSCNDSIISSKIAKGVHCSGWVAGEENAEVRGESGHAQDQECDAEGSQ